MGNRRTMTVVNKAPVRPSHPRESEPAARLLNPRQREQVGVGNRKGAQRNGDVAEPQNTTRKSKRQRRTWFNPPWRVWSPTTNQL